ARGDRDAAPHDPDRAALRPSVVGDQATVPSSAEVHSAVLRRRGARGTQAALARLPPHSGRAHEHKGGRLADAFRSGWRDSLLDTLTSAARLLPRGRTTAHRACWRALGAPSRFVGRVDGQFFCVDARDTDISTTIYLRQEWEPPSTAVWKALLAPGQVVVDVGANKGWFSLLAARRVMPGGCVISYEPLPRNVADIEVTSAANQHRHWQVRAVAASDHPGVAQLVSPRDDSGTGWGSLQRQVDSGDNVVVDVEVVTLAEDLASLGVDRVDLLKMDIEGHE